jgi:hypothetical protein
MSASEMIEKLQKYPPHFEVKCWWNGMAESDDFTAEICHVENFAPSKIISLEMDTRPLADEIKHPKV